MRLENGADQCRFGCRSQFGRRKRIGKHSGDVYDELEDEPDQAILKQAALGNF
ncbi:MAG: hypothetical protein HKN47_16335 [Pirellulaceae bacterium]|nr:hypothetical protein [Pirellulaceae bacterium]